MLRCTQFSGLGYQHVQQDLVVRTRQSAGFLSLSASQQQLAALHSRILRVKRLFEFDLLDAVVAAAAVLLSSTDGDDTWPGSTRLDNSVPLCH